jgi:predicted regulator of Ras-like GTPase activity (Roadblock/LC7/MglB family)
LRGDGPQRLISILESTQKEEPSVVGLLLADGSGLPVVDSFREHMDLMAVSAMSTLILQSARTVFENLSLKGGTCVIMQGEDSVILVRGVTSDLSLILLADGDANLGLLNLQMERVGREVESLLGEA